MRTGRLVLQMREYLVDDRLVLDRGNDPGLGAADAASLYIDVEDPLESLRASHGYMTIGLFVLLALLCCVPPTCFPRRAGVTNTRCVLLGANTPWQRAWAAPSGLPRA